MYLGITCGVKESAWECHTAASSGKGWPEKTRGTVLSVAFVRFINVRCTMIEINAWYLRKDSIQMLFPLSTFGESWNPLNQLSSLARLSAVTVLHHPGAPPFHSSLSLALILISRFLFLDASSHLYMRVCPSVRMSVYPYVRPLPLRKKRRNRPKS